MIGPARCVCSLFGSGRRGASRWFGVFGLACSGLSPEGVTRPQALDAGESSDAGPELRLVVGSGEDSFASVEPGQSVEVVAGSQGGFHVPLSLRLYGTETQRLLMRLSTQWEGVEGTEVPPPTATDGTASADIAVRFQPVVDEKGASALELLDWTAFLFRPQCADGQRLEVSVQLFLRPEARTSPEQEPMLAQASAVWSLAVDESHQAGDCAVEAGSPL